MKDLKTGFSDRITAQQEAKKALLAKFKPKAAAPDQTSPAVDFIAANLDFRPHIGFVRPASGRAFLRRPIPDGRPWPLTRNPDAFA